MLSVHIEPHKTMVWYGKKYKRTKYNNNAAATATTTAIAEVI